MGEQLIIKGYKHSGGKHCQTAALKNILNYHGLDFSEEMLLGLGGGIGFIYWYMKMMPAPFIGGRGGGKGEAFLENILERIGAGGTISQTTSVQKGYDQLKKLLREGEPAYVFVDIAYLPYMAVPEVAHFGGHTIVVYKLDENENKVSASDCARSTVTVTIEDLGKARGSKFPPFPPKNKIMKINFPVKVRNLEKGVKGGIRDCCEGMMNPPIKNIGLAGIKKWASLVPKWPQQFRGMNLVGCLFNVFLYIEIGGTGGSAFRTMYAGFLREAAVILKNRRLEETAGMFEESAKAWSKIADAALPDSWASLKGIRELSTEKQRIFEEQRPGALERMIKISAEIEGLLKKAVKDLERKSSSSLFFELQQRILECCELEQKAFNELRSAVK